MIQTVFLGLSAVVTIAAAIPYMVAVAKKRTKPRIVSWLNWSLLTAIAAAAALADKQYPSAVMSISATVECMAVVILGLKLGDRKFELFDIACQAGAILGLVLWIIFNSPIVAIIASAAIDLIASLPTLRHIWQKPHEETASLFMLSALGAVFALLALRHPQASGLIMPIYIVCINLAMTSTFLITPHKKRPKISRQS